MSDNQLEKVKQAFKNWRATKKSGETIPEYLWDWVRNLIFSQKHKPSMIGRELSISSGQLKRKFPEHYPYFKKTVKSADSMVMTSLSKPLIPPAISTNKKKEKKENVQPKFVEAPLSSLFEKTNRLNPTTLILQRPNGTQLMLQAPPSELIDKALTYFMEH